MPNRGELSRITAEVESLLHGPVWHGPALFEILEEVTPGIAAAKPVPGRHSIWELMKHLDAWLVISTHRVCGQEVEPSEEEDWPAVTDTSGKAWQEQTAQIVEHSEQLKAAMATLGPEDLDKLAPGRTHTIRTMLYGVLYHFAYHGGQVALLLRAAQESRPAQGQDH